MKRFLTCILLAIIIAVISGCGRTVQEEPLQEPDYYESHYLDELYDELDEPYDEPYEAYDMDEEPPIEVYVPDEEDEPAVPLRVITCHLPGWVNRRDQEAAPITLSSVIPFDLVDQYFLELDEIFDKDAGELWGRCFHAPFIIVCRETRNAVANQPDPHGILVRQGYIYAGQFPDELFVGNTIVSFGGQRWAMATWCTMERLADDTAERLRLMAHEIFHYWQNRILGQNNHGDNSHMDEKYGRIKIQLEINALIAAWSSAGDERLAAIHDALSIRAARQEMFGSRVVESRADNHEGLAVYTEFRLAGGDEAVFLDNMEMYADVLMYVDSNIGWMSSYASGALYATLLDEFEIAWREGFRANDSDMSAILREALNMTDLTPFDELDLEQYNFAEIYANTVASIEAHEAMLDDVREIFRTQPTIRLRRGDYTTVAESAGFFDLPGMGVVHWVNVTVSGSFGRIHMREGYFLNNINGGYRLLAAEGMWTEGDMIFGNDWELELNEGFELYWDGDSYIIRRRQG